MSPAQTDKQPNDIYAGLMSGTSMDGVDGVLLAFDPQGGIQQTIAHAFVPMPSPLRQQLTDLQTPAANELTHAARASLALADLYSECTHQLLKRSALDARQVRALGAHGQTVRHAPQEGYSLQLLNASHLAERTGIDVIADLRSADLAAGGQGAPLMPAFHAHIFSRQTEPGHYGILNLGGIANLTIINTQEQPARVTGFDTGPANTLLDNWIESHLGQRYDHNGQWAATGKPIPALLTRLLAEPYFARPAPKSTGRDLFNLAWLQQHLQQLPDPPHTPADVQATLLALTAASVAQAIQAHPLRTVYLCGGGARNVHLCEAIQQAIGPHIPLLSTAALGIAPEAMEASGFAWLARQRTHNIPIDLSAITGARHRSILGAWHKHPPG
ncbi:MAG: anhydro-N-acetylmuramic acid kinase [Lautropia sp.]|nr:anhydro-N-acetylmuramic acid kinase [Lautropia sp.]